MKEPQRKGSCVNTCEKHPRTHSEGTGGPQNHQPPGGAGPGVLAQLVMGWALGVQPVEKDRSCMQGQGRGLDGGHSLSTWCPKPRAPGRGEKGLGARPRLSEAWRLERRQQLRMPRREDLGVSC